MGLSTRRISVTGLVLAGACLIAGGRALADETHQTGDNSSTVNCAFTKDGCESTPDVTSPAPAPGGWGPTADTPPTPPPCPKGSACWTKLHGAPAATTTTTTQAGATTPRTPHKGG